MKYQLKRPQIGITCFVFDGTTYDEVICYIRSDMENNVIAGIISQIPFFLVYIEVPYCHLEKFQTRCSFGHDRRTFPKRWLYKNPNTIHQQIFIPTCRFRSWRRVVFFQMYQHISKERFSRRQSHAA